jgi:hypothetical protein
MKTQNKKIFFGLLALFLILGLSFFAASNSLAESCPSQTTITGTTATLVGELTSTGGADVNYVWFEYGKTRSYGYKTFEKSLNQSGLYCIVVSNLTPCALYHYRAAARNEAGTSYGQDKQFKTSCGFPAIVKKQVRNLSDGTDFRDSVTADPSEVLTFSIEIIAKTYLSNLFVKDDLPDKLIYQPESLKVNGASFSGDITSGINFGAMSAGEKKSIVYNVYVAKSDKFSLGENILFNSVKVFGNNDSESDAVKITVVKKAVKGAATTVSTGLTNDIFKDSFLLPLLITIFLLWLLKSPIVKFEEWLDRRKIQYQAYKSEKTLQAKIKKIKIQELLNSKLNILKKDKGFLVLFLDFLFVFFGILLLIFGLLQNQKILTAVLEKIIR